MSFINPAFLWAMFAVSVPIVIHLINFRRHKTLYFSNTRFLEDIKKETQTKTKLRHLLILLARILTIIMLVLAFAGPFIPSETAVDTAKSEINIVYIDNSFSMEAEGLKGQVFEQAKQISKQIAFNSSASMEYLLITNDMLPQHQFLIDRDALISNIDKTEISSNSINLNDVILKANTIIPDDKNASLYILSDLQKSFMDEVSIKPDDNINIVFIPLASTEVNNLYIDTCWFETPVHRLGQEEKLKVKIVNNSNEDFFDTPVQLFVNDTLKALSSFNILAGQTEKVEIDFVNTESGHSKARLEISDYPVTYDNNLYFNFNVAEKTDVLIISAGQNNRYLNSLFASDSENFDFSQVRLGNEQSTSFKNYDFIVLNNITDLSSGLTSDIETFVSEGGSVVFIPSVEISYNSCNKFLSTFNAGRFDNMKFTGKRIFSLDYSHQLFKNVFTRRDNQTDMPVMGLVHKYVLFNSSSFSNVISLENGSPLLSAGSYKNGKIYILASPLSDNNSEFVKSTIFVPMVFNMALNSQINNSLYALMEQGASLLVNSSVSLASTDIFRITDKNQMDAVAEFNYVGKTIRVFVPKAIKEAGNYQLLQGVEYIAPVSLNYNRRESDLTFYNTEELSDFITENLNDRAKVIEANSDNINEELKEFSEGRPLWQLFLLFALFFILCEIAIARFLK